jgi:hypothetical protein
MSTKTTFFELTSYSVILAVLVVMTYTLTMIYFFNRVEVIEPNKLILVNEIGLTILGITFSLNKIRRLITPYLE